MRILLIGQYFAPEDVSGAVLATELAIDLASKGHQITFLTGAPNYPLGQIYAGYRNRFYSQEMIKGVRVVRIWSYISPRKTFWRRIFNYGTFSASAFYGGLLAGKPDVVLSASPPFPLGFSTWLLSQIWRVPWLLRVEDLFPEAAIITGVIRNRTLIAVLFVLERFFYRKATQIAVISEGFRKYLLDMGVPQEKVSIIPVWADPNFVQPLPKENAFRRKHDLNGQFVVMYSGNLGYTSNLEDVIEAAEILKDEPDLQFVFVGEGVKKKALEDLVRQKKLNNFRLLPFQPREEFATMLAAANVGVVTLDPNIAHTCLPGKTFNIMASSRPILAIAPPNSELAQLVGEANCGVCISPGEPSEVALRILELRESAERTNKMGQNGRSHLIRHFSRKQSVDLFERAFLEINQERINK